MAGTPRRNPPRELGRVEVQSYGVETVDQIYLDTAAAAAAHRME